MKIKFAGKWYEVAMVQYNFGKPYYEIYDEPDTDPEHTDWITHPEEVIDDESENSSFYTVSNIETDHQPTENSNDELPMIHLTKEGTVTSQVVSSKKNVFDDNIIIRRDFTGKKLSPEEFQEFQKIVNERRPYCSSDFKKQHFTPDKL